MNNLLEILIDMYISDIEMFSNLLTQYWNWFLLGIPSLAYLCFFFIKWASLTFPVWGPLYILISALKDSINPNKTTTTQ